MKHKVLLSCLLALICQSTLAQWQLGVEAGCGITSITRSQAGRVDETYGSRASYDIGIYARYSILNWLAIRADLELTERNHRMERNLAYIQPVYTIYRNTYLQLPVMADFSFGGKKVRGHMYAGGFAGALLSGRNKGTTFWMTDDNIYFQDFDVSADLTERNRVTAGLVGGAGLSYDVTDRIILDATVLYYYDLVSYQKDSSKHISDPRYLNTLGITIGAAYKF